MSLGPNDVRVGVTLVRDGCEPDPGDSGEVSVRAHWVKIGDVLLGRDVALLSIEHRADNGPGVVTIQMACSSYATVDHRDLL